MKAIKIEPNNTQGYVVLGDLFVELNRFEEAEREFRKALEIDSNDADANIALEELLTELKSFNNTKEEHK
jgi:Tfp pilus assembly protein PilF